MVDVDLPPEKGIFHLLLAYDSMYMVEQHARVHAPISTGQLQFIRLLREGYIEAVRWLHPDGSLGQLNSYYFEVEDLEAASEFLFLGRSYSIVSDFFRLYSQGLAQYEIRQNKTVRFQYREGVVGTPFGFIEAEQGDFDEFISKQEVEAPLLDDMTDQMLSAEHKLISGRVVITAPDHLPMQFAREFYAKMYDLTDYFNLDDSLGGITLREFIDVFLGLRFWSECCLFKYVHLSMAGTPQEECMPTQLLPRPYLVRRLSRLTGVRKEAVDLSIDLLTYDPGAKRPDAIVTPLFSIGNCILWSSHALNSCRQPRNLFRSLARNPTFKAVADNLIGERERRFADEVVAFLKSKGWISDRSIKIKRQGEMDIIAWHEAEPSTALAIELKMILAPDELNEVHQASKYLAEGQEQARAFRHAFLRLTSSERRALSTELPLDIVEDLKCIVISPSAEMTANEPLGDTPALAWTTIKRQVSESDFRSANAIHRILSLASWRDAIDVSQKEWVREVIGKFTFELPGFVTET